MIATKFGFKLDPNGEPKWVGLDSRPEHIAIVEQLDNGKTADWMEKVGDEQYEAYPH